MKDDSLKFMKDMLAAPSPSGFEQPAQEVFRRRVKDVSDSVRTDVHGNAIAVLNSDAKLRLMLAGHIDQIGFQISFIDNDGFLYFGSLGGHDPFIVVGQRVLIHTAKGVVQGVIGKKAIHLMSPEERKDAPKLEDLWIDIGAKNKKDAQKVVSIGDPVTYSLGYLELMNKRVVCPGFDDKVGSYVVAETMRFVAEKKKSLKVAVYGVSTVQEEVGIRGARTSAYGIDPHVGIAIDVGFASDHPTLDKKKVGEAYIGKGPMMYKGTNINPIVCEGLQSIAKKKKIPYQFLAAPGPTGTDANAIQLNRSGVAAGLISIPNRYMHTPNEVVSLDDLDNAVKLLGEYILSLTGKESFIPR